MPSYAGLTTIVHVPAVLLDACEDGDRRLVDVGQVVLIECLK